jgi:uncharacterized protein YebE (UPF0316 family)
MTTVAQASSVLAEPAIWVPLGIFCARVIDVSMGTVRLICVTRGHRTVAVALGFVETTIWVLAVSAVFRHLDRWINIAAFAGGYATGVAVGMWIERKLALGWQVVTFMSRLAGHTVADRLRQAEWMVTTLEGNGHYGPVSVSLAVVPRKHVPLVVEAARQADPQAVVTIEDVVERNGGAGPPSGLECVSRNQALWKAESGCNPVSRDGMAGLQVMADGQSRVRLGGTIL